MERRSSRDRDDRDEGSRGRDREERGSRDRDDDRGSRRSRDDDDRGSRSSGRGSSYQYERRSREEVEDRASRGGKDFDKFLKDHLKTYSVQKGDNEIRVLPPTWSFKEYPKQKHYGFEIWVHYGVGPDRQSYLCPHKMKGEKCPICEEREDALRDGDEKYAKQLEPKRRSLIYLVDRKDEKEGVQAWAMPWTVDRDLLKISVDKKSGRSAPHRPPEEGYDVMFEKEGEKDRTKYEGVTIARRESELGSQKWLDYAMDNPLPEQLVYFSYEHIAKAFGGGGGGEHQSGRDRDEDDRGGAGTMNLVGARRREERSSRDDDRGASRSRDRDESRSSRDDGDRGGRERGRERSRVEEPEFTWEKIHEMTGDELEALVEDQKLDINPDKADSDADLADWICEEMKIKKEEKKRTRMKADDDDGDERTKRLEEMRSRRRD
jgi:hypothetical protein